MIKFETVFNEIDSITNTIKEVHCNNDTDPRDLCLPVYNGLKRFKKFIDEGNDFVGMGGDNFIAKYQTYIGLVATIQTLEECLTSRELLFEAEEYLHLYVCSMLGLNVDASFGKSPEEEEDEEF